jgi:hypothetical protein
MPCEIKVTTEWTAECSKSFQTPLLEYELLWSNFDKPAASNTIASVAHFLEIFMPG